METNTKINITKVRDDWYIATLIDDNGRISNGYGKTKDEAIDNLREAYLYYQTETA